MSHWEKPDWAVIVEMPEKRFTMSSNKDCTGRSLSCSQASSLHPLPGILLSRFITRPLILLRDATREINKGNLDTQVEITSMNEIGVTNSFSG